METKKLKNLERGNAIIHPSLGLAKVVRGNSPEHCVQIFSVKTRNTYDLSSYFGYNQDDEFETVPWDWTKELIGQ